jgi:hypothetical protein
MNLTVSHHTVLMSRTGGWTPPLTDTNLWCGFQLHVRTTLFSPTSTSRYHNVLYMYVSMLLRCAYFMCPNVCVMVYPSHQSNHTQKTEWVT